MEELGVDPGAAAAQADALRQGRCDGDVPRDRRHAGRPHRRRRPDQGDDGRRRLRPCDRAGVRIVMLTGDNRTTAEAVARKLGIDEIEAEVLPEQKSRW